SDDPRAQSRDRALVGRCRVGDRASAARGAHARAGGRARGRFEGAQLRHAGTGALTRPAAVYLNVDLEVRSRSNLSPLVNALERRLLLLYAGRARGLFFASFDIAGMTLTPDAAISLVAKELS